MVLKTITLMVIGNESEIQKIQITHQSQCRIEGVKLFNIKSEKSTLLTLTHSLVHTHSE